MVRVIMHGCNGKMGQVITGIVNEDADTVIVAGVDPYDDGHNNYPVFWLSMFTCSIMALGFVAVTGRRKRKDI